MNFGLNGFNPTGFSRDKGALSLKDETQAQAYGLKEWSRDKTLDLGAWLE